MDIVEYNSSYVTICYNNIRLQQGYVQSILMKKEADRSRLAQMSENMDLAIHEVIPEGSTIKSLKTSGRS